MARSVLDIVIRLAKQGGADKETVKGLTEIKKTVGNILPVFAAFTGAAIAVDKVLDATVGEYIKYAEQVEHAKVLTGASAEETSRIIQLADDQRVSVEELTKALQFANKAGYQPNIEGLGQLSDQYLAIQDPVERVNFLLKTFGKEGADMEKVMKLGSKAIHENAAAISDELVVTDQGVAEMQEYKRKTDDLADAKQALAYATGKFLLPIENQWLDLLVDLFNTLNGEAPVLDHATKQTLLHRAATDAVTQSYIAWAQSIENSQSAMEDAGPSAEELSAHYKSLLDITSTLQEGYDRFAEKNREIFASMDEASQQLADGQITFDEYNAKIRDLSGELDENAKAAELWSKKFIVSMAQARLAASGDGIDKNKFTFLIQLQENLGLIDKKTADMAEHVNDALDNIDLSNAENFASLWQEILGMPSDKTFTISVVGNMPDYNNPGTVGGGNRYATGGGFDAGAPMQVHQDEIIVPGFNGVVLTRTDAMRLISGQGNGKGNKNITIYGGLTVVAQGSVMDVLDELS